MSCHGGIPIADERAFGPLSDCVACHEPDEESVRRESARLTASAPRTATIRFEHAEHLVLPEVRGQCVPCHAGVAEDGVRGKVFPPMAECTSCHQGELASAQCAVCHRHDDLRNTVPRAFLRHDLGFVRDHGLAATRHDKACQQCHAEADCTACHDASQTLQVDKRWSDAIGRELVHRADFESRHGIEARSQPTSCLRCHTPSSCDSCHVERGVSANRVGSVNPHPLGWIGPNPAAESFHGRLARRDILSCVGCHEQGPATSCIRCHKVGGFGGNPHPSGWSSARSPQDAMCRYCHGR